MEIRREVLKSNQSPEDLEQITYKTDVGTMVCSTLMSKVFLCEI